MRSASCRLTAVTIAILLTAQLQAQNHVLTAGSANVLPGDPADIAVTLDNPDPVRGFSFGLTNDGALITLSTIDQGSVVLAANGGAGADFFFTDTNPIGGPGGVCGCVLSLSAPLDDIAPGTDQEIAILHYQATGSATPGAVSPLDFTSNLGDPPVAVVVSVAGVTVIPDTNSGQVAILPPPVEGLLCTLVDPCACEFQLTWTDPAAYDAIVVLQDGNVAATLGGSATSANITLSGPGSGAELCVVPQAGGLEGDPTCCMVGCPIIDPPPGPSMMSCVVDDMTCTATVTWMNDSTYDSLDIALDGSVVQTLPGDAESAIVTLPGVGSYQICISGGYCAVPFADVCCTADCAGNPGPQFIRGDVDGDGQIQINDPIGSLTFLFGSGAVPCVDACDVDDDGLVQINDPILELTYLFGSGPPPAPPFPTCGEDPTPDDAGTDLGCDGPVPSC